MNTLTGQIFGLLPKPAVLGRRHGQEASQQLRIDEPESVQQLQRRADPERIAGIRRLVDSPLEPAHLTLQTPANDFLARYCMQSVHEVQRRDSAIGAAAVRFLIRPLPESIIICLISVCEHLKDNYTYTDNERTMLRSTNWLAAS